MGHSIAPIPVAADYMSRFGGTSLTPVIMWEFYPGRGWVRSGWRKRVSGAWVRRLACEGATDVALEVTPDRTADFTVAELLASARR